MQMYSDRRMTQQSAKRGPPRRGHPEKPAGVRRKISTGNQPARHLAPTRRASPDDHDVHI